MVPASTQNLWRDFSCILTWQRASRYQDTASVSLSALYSLRTSSVRMTSPQPPPPNTAANEFED